MLRRFFASSLILAAFAVAACGRGTSIPTSPSSVASFTGTYVLQTVNGAPLPYTLLDLGDAFKFVVVNDVLTFRSGGVVTEVNTSRTIQSGSTSTESQTATGSFTVQGNVITVIWPSSGSYDYTSSGNGLSVFEPVFKVNWVYRKQ